MLTLRYRATTAIPVEAECLSPDHFAGKSPAEIAVIPVQHGNRQVPLGEFFDVTGDAADREIAVAGDCGRVKWIGTAMTAGRITIYGNAGMHLGSEMRGGEIEVHGHAGDWVGAEMRGGRIRVRGNAGDLAGAGYRGSRKGMRGGTILIEGNAGSEIGSVMRRGLIAVGGSSGDFAGVSLIAGSIVLFGPAGLRIGAGMQRGTVAVLGECPPLLPSFRFDCEYRPLFLNLYLRQLRQWGFPIAPELFAATFCRYSGDLVSLGKGEILQRV